MTNAISDRFMVPDVPQPALLHRNSGRRDEEIEGTRALSLDVAGHVGGLEAQAVVKLGADDDPLAGGDAERVPHHDLSVRLETRVLDIAKRIAEVPPAVVSINKRFVYTSMEMRASRAIVRTAADLQNGPHLPKLSAEDIKAQVTAANKARTQP